MPPVDVRDPLEAERFEALDAEAFHTRRDFLQRTAVMAGLAASMGALLDPDAVVAEAARRQRRAALPSPRNLPIDTFVVLMMENRSFDHYLGWLPGADGRQAGLQFTDPRGNTHATHRLLDNYQGCGFLDPDHSWDGGRTEMDGGRMDGFLRADSDVFSIGYYAEQDLPFTPHLAKAFTAFDRFFCSLLSSTYPNREYMHAGQSYGMKDNSLPLSSGGFPDTTIFASLAQAGVSNRYFYTDIPVSALWGSRGPGALEPGPDLLRAGGGRDPARAVVRRSVVQRRGPGHLRRRAPARRRAGRPGVHLRRRARVHRVAAVQARRAVRRLRRVGRVLRPRRAAARPRPAREFDPRATTSVRWGSGSRRWSSRRTPARATSTTRSTGSSRS